MTRYLSMFSIFVLSGMLVACSKDDDDTSFEQNQREIKMLCIDSWSESQTRAIGSNDFCPEISVSASFFDTAWDGASCTPNFLHRMQADLNGEKNGYAFHGGSIWYWPNSGNMRFFAYGPYEQVVSGLTDDTASGAPQLTYTCPSPQTQQYDIQYAESSDYPCATSGAVGLPFNHILSALAVTMSPAIGTIDNIQLQGMATRATYTPGSGWSSYSGYSTTYAWQNLSSGNGIFVALMPQQLALAAQPKLVVSITTTGGENKVLTYDLKANNVVWQAGKIYHYDILVGGGTWYPPGPQPTTDIIIGIADWTFGGAAIIPIRDEKGDIVSEDGNHLVTQPAVYDYGATDGERIDFVYTSGTHIQGMIEGASTDGSVGGGDQENDIEAYGDGENDHGSGANNEGNSDIPTSSDTNNQDYTDGTNGTPDQSDQNDHSSTVNGQDDSGNSTDGNAGNGDHDDDIDPMHDSGDNHNSDGRRGSDDSADHNGMDNTAGTDDYTDGTEGTPDQSDMDPNTSTVNSNTDGGSTDGGASNGDQDNNIDPFGDSGDNHDSSANNENNTDQPNGIGPTNQDYDGNDGANDNGDVSGQSSTVGPMDDSGNSTDGSASAGDQENPVAPFEDGENDFTGSAHYNQAPRRTD